ncbi:MAG: hypothetical protein IT317_06430 [Anaerolineales bacterium]|nr:hypothetical protein [Anaerolineales bacterium]
MNTKQLIRWAGLAALVAGLCFAARELLEPPDIHSSVTTPQWATAHYLSIAMSLFGLLGVTGIYARQAGKAGWLGVAGYLLLSLWLVLSLTFTFFEAFVLPLVAAEAPAFAETYLLVISRSTGEMTVGALTALWGLSDILFVLGSLVFGVATLRAGVLSRWAAGLFTIGIGVAPAYGLLPTALQPLVAVPIGLGLAWLGYSLWSEKRLSVTQPVTGPGMSLVRQIGAD